jgi:hypothetical protein
MTDEHIVSDEKIAELQELFAVVEGFTPDQVAKLTEEVRKKTPAAVDEILRNKREDAARWRRIDGAIDFVAEQYRRARIKDRAEEKGFHNLIKAEAKAENIVAERFYRVMENSKLSDTAVTACCLRALLLWLDDNTNLSLCQAAEKIEKELRALMTSARPG